MAAAPARSVDAGVVHALAELKRSADRRTLEEMGPRYGIIAKKAFGVPMAKLQLLAKSLGKSHELAAALWATGWYEARLVASMVDEPERVTPAQMDRWAKDFDNWGVCDTVCFKLFDQSPHAFARAEAWAKRREEFVRRAGFALLACLALHDKTTGDAAFRRTLPLLERGAEDDRNFVKKSVSWALRAIGRRSPALRAESTALAQRLAESDNAAARWVGKDALRDLKKR